MCLINGLFKKKKIILQHWQYTKKKTQMILEIVKFVRIFK